MAGTTETRRWFTVPDPGNFSDVPWPGGPPPPHHETGEPAVVLRRVRVEEQAGWGGARPHEEFELLRRVRYHDEHSGLTVTVPATPGFTSDLASVPRWLTWLVPRSGTHLPAVLVHDGLVGEPQYETDPPGVRIDRVEADRIMRDAMRDTHVGRIRRWLVWAAVTAVSLVVGARVEWRWWHRTWSLLAVLGTLAVLLYLGTAATADLLDRQVVGLWDLPWMHGPFASELLGGAAGAVVVPLLLALAWGRYYRAGAIGGVALATLLHVTAAVAVVALAYQALERATRTSTAFVSVAVLVVVGAVVVFGVELVG